jgi:hypothetical protein
VGNAIFCFSSLKKWVFLFGISYYILIFLFLAGISCVKIIGSYPNVINSDAIGQKMI